MHPEGGMRVHSYESVPRPVEEAWSWARLNLQILDIGNSAREYADGQILGCSV